MSSRRLGRRVRGHWLLLTVLAVGTAAWLFAQSAPRADIPAPVLRVTTRLVLLDVVVVDKDGRPVTDLTEPEFTLLDNGNPQKIAVFSFEQPAKQPPEPLPLLPPNVFTNEPSYRTPPGPLTILLLDLLNTPLEDQAYSREQMLRYLKTQLQPDQRVAILALTRQLHLLQDFTSDPRLLLAAMERIRTKPVPTGTGPEDNPDMLLAMIAQAQGWGPNAFEAITGSLIRLESEQISMALDRRVQITLDALEKIARAVGGYRGRKNLIWVSAAFPFTLTPDRIGRFNRADQAGFSRSFAGSLRQTASFLADSQVAVYPVDASGLVGAAIGGAETKSIGTVGIGSQAASNLNQAAASASMSHDTMNELAKETGGRAFYNRNDIDNSVALSVADGSTYYTLGYYPEHKKWDGKFHRLEVRVQRSSLAVRHRRGYYADEPLLPAKPPGEPVSKEEKKEKEMELLTALLAPLPATGVSFRATVPLPVPAKTTHVEVQLEVSSDAVLFEPAAGGTQRCNVDFLTAAFSPTGEIVKYVYQTLDANLRPETFARVRHQGIPYKTQLELPLGNYSLRIAVRDNRTGLLGTVEIPLVMEGRQSSP